MLRTVLLFVLLVPLTVAQSAPAPRTRRAPEDTVKKLEQQWLDSVAARQQAVLDELLAPDFRAIAIDGKTRERPQELATLIDDTRPALSRFFGRLDISTPDPTVVLARGLIVINGENIREAHIAFTHVWVLRKTKWQLLASQETLENY